MKLVWKHNVVECFKTFYFILSLCLFIYLVFFFYDCIVSLVPVLYANMSICNATRIFFFFFFFTSSHVNYSYNIHTIHTIYSFFKCHFNHQCWYKASFPNTNKCCNIWVHFAAFPQIVYTVYFINWEEKKDTHLSLWEKVNDVSCSFYETVYTETCRKSPCI